MNGTDDLEASEAIVRQTAILAAGLSIDDPETIPGLVYPLPADAELATLVQDYDTQRSTGRKVRCSACSQHQFHYRGFVVELADGARALIGINCGEAHFGEGEWKGMHARLRQKQDMAYFEARIAPTLRQIEICYPTLVAWREAVGRLEVRPLLQRVLPDFHRMIVAACRENEGHLHRYRYRRVVEQAANGTERLRKEVETIPYGTVPAPLAYLDGSLRKKLSDASEDLRVAKNLLLGDPDAISLKAAFKRLRNGLKEIEDAAEICRGHRRNLAGQWWHGACRMFTDEAGEQITLNGRTLLLKSYSTTKVRLPDEEPPKLWNAALAAWPR